MDASHQSCGHKVCGFGGETPRWVLLVAHCANRLRREEQSLGEGARRCVVRRVSEPARKVGLKFGIYLPPSARHEPPYQNSAAYDGYYIAHLHALAATYAGLA